MIHAQHLNYTSKDGIRKAILFLVVLISFSSTISLADTQQLSYESVTKESMTIYDSTNRATAKNSSLFNASYAYDSQYEGTLTNVTFQNSTFKYDYDDKLRLTKETKIIDGISFERRILYDSSGRVLKQQFIPGTGINYTHDVQGNINKIPSIIPNSSHNAFGNLKNRTYANNEITTFSYDSMERVVSIITGSKQNLNFTYDLTGKIVVLKDIVNNMNYYMSYDFLDRLVNATVSPYYFIYSYDPAGRILKIARNNTNTTKFVYGTYPVHAPARIETLRAGIDVHKEEELYSGNKTRAIQFYLANDRNASVSSVNWTAKFSSVVASTNLLNLGTNESVLVVVAGDFPSGGAYYVNTTAFSGPIGDYENLSVRFGIGASSLEALFQDGSKQFYEFRIANDMAEQSANASWSCDDGIVSSSSFQLSGNENAMVIIQSNYSVPGQKDFSCSVSSADGNGIKTIGHEMKGITLEDYSITPITRDKSIVNFTLRNYWDALGITWFIDTLTGSSSLGNGAEEAIGREITHTGGQQTILVNASSGSVVAKLNESVVLKPLRLEDYYIENSTETDRIFVFSMANRWTQNQSAYWNVSSISAVEIANLTSEEFVFVVVQRTIQLRARRGRWWGQAPE